MPEVEWRGDALRAAAERALFQKMQQVGAHLTGRVKRKINRGNARGTNPSKPGEPPKKVTERLFRSVTSWTFRKDGKIYTVVGTNVEYARRLELGFTGTEQVKAHQRKITQAFGRRLKEAKTIDVKAYARPVSFPARPFLRPTLQEELPQIRRFLGGGA